MIHFVSGDFFALPADVLVNTVNCRGVMGAGVALAFRLRFPAMFESYRAVCAQGLLRPGGILPFAVDDRTWVVNIATKDHYRRRSRVEWVEAGLVALREFLESHRSARVVMPALGCGNGGLDWEHVRELIGLHLDGVDAEIFVFAPDDSRSAGERARGTTCHEAHKAEGR